MATSSRLFRLALGLVLIAGQPLSGRDLVMMPDSRDYTSMWWAEGFPTVVPGAPWRRCIQTGYYAMVLDTETLEIPHLGAVPSGTSYLDCGRGDEPAWNGLPDAVLELKIAVNGKNYLCAGGGEWGRFVGPRLIESGRFLQRADITGLVFQSSGGEYLNVRARLETVAWPDRLTLMLSAKPGLMRIRAGEKSFGRIGGGFGLDGMNHFEIPHEAELDPAQFTLELWAFVPADYRVSKRTSPWLICKNRNENTEGNFGIMIVNGRARARMNIGGGVHNVFDIDSEKLKLEAWSHLAMTYDGDTLRFHLNGALAGEQKVARQRKPGKHAFAVGRREDGGGDGYHFRGVVDEVRLYDRALGPAELLQRFRQPEVSLPSVRNWNFRSDGKALMTRLEETWKDPAIEIVLSSRGRSLRDRAEGSKASLVFDPVQFKALERGGGMKVEAGGRPIVFDHALGWHRINLDGIEPILPNGDPDRQNDAIERLRFSLTNSSEKEQLARLLFEKTARGFRQRIGSPITGISAILRDSDGNPTGIPVQLSKNWHNEPEGGVYSGAWFHGVSQVRVPAGTRLELELILAYGHWGGVPAASHAQLSLIGWGTNQLWDESSLGSWGESICYEPDQIQGGCSITDVRPLMVRPKNGKGRWSWTNNVGGGDFFRTFDKSGARTSHSAMRATYQRHGPCLTEVTYSGRIGGWGRHSETASLSRSDDIVRATYRLRLDVTQATELSRFVIFQVGADTYNQTREAKMALGNEKGLLKEWSTRSGGDGYHSAAVECSGRIPWMSLHQGAPFRIRDETGAWANRGIIIRSWRARLGGEEASPWIAEHGTSSRGGDTSTLDVVPPPGIKNLQAGDFVEAIIEYIVMPQSADDYYGPDWALRSALASFGNTWRMIHREATRNVRQIVTRVGELEALYPAVRVRASGEMVSFALTGGLGFVPITITGLRSHRDYVLNLDGRVVDQCVHGKDFWQTDFDSDSRDWSRTYNLPITDQRSHLIEFAPAK